MKLPGGIQAVLRKTLLDEILKLLPDEHRTLIRSSFPSTREREWF